jgi:hypothetical protein
MHLLISKLSASSPYFKLTQVFKARQFWIIVFGLFTSLASYIFITGTMGSVFQTLSEAQYDDSYITYRYVQNMQLGNGFRFNLNDSTTNSASSFLFAMLLFVVSSIAAIDLPTTSLFIGTVSLALSAGVVASFSIYRSYTLLGAGLGVSASAILVSNPTLLYWSFSGMETTFFTLLLIVATVATYVFLAKQDVTITNLIITSAALICLSLVRWEGAIVALALSSYLLLILAIKRDKQKVFVGLVPFLSVTFSISALLIFYKLYYGHFVPDPVTFKRISNYYTQGPEEIFSAIVTFLKMRVLDDFLILALVGSLIAIPLAFRFRDIRFGLLELVPLISLLSATLVILVGAYADEFRYIAPLVGIGALLVTQLSSALRLTNRTLVKSFLSFSILSFTVFVGYQSVLTGMFQSKEIIRGLGYQYLQYSRIEMGNWIERNLPHGSRVLSDDIGAISFYSPSLIFIDPGGLTNHDLLEDLFDKKSYSSIITKSNPDYMVGTTDPKIMETGAEWLFNNPSKYFDPAAIQVSSNCAFNENFSKTLLLQIPEDGDVPLTITAWELGRIKDCNNS